MAENLVKRIIEGRYDGGGAVLPLDAMNERCVENIERKFNSLPEFEEKLLQCKDAVERVTLLHPCFEWIPCRSDGLREIGKNEELSAALRELGNKHYKMKMTDTALRCYNLAIMFAPKQSVPLGLAFANRSAVLQTLEKPEECLRDVELACENGYPEQLKGKLESRASKCKSLMAIKCDQTDNNCVSEELQKRRKFRDNFLLRVKKPHSQIPAMEDFVEVAVAEDRGRKLVVTRDIPAGTVLLVENPFVSVLVNELTWETFRCHFCLQKITGGIPCSDCTFAIYCDKECRGAAERDFHSYECKLLPYLHSFSTPRYMLLALRIVLKLGPEKVRRLWQNSKPLEVSELDKTFLDRQEEENYERVSHMICHTDKLSALELYSNAFHSLSLISALDKTSEFFSSCEDKLQRSELIKFVAATLTQHAENILCNSISLDQVIGLEKLSLADSLTKLGTDQVKSIVKAIDYEQFAAGVYPVASLINHSCDPNVTRVCGPKDGKLAIVATRGIIAGEEVCTCYSKYFANDARHQRRQYLERSYHFKCCCIACRFDWPLLAEMAGTNESFCCVKCSKRFRREERNSSTEFAKCVLKGRGKVKCNLCHAVYTYKDVSDEFHKQIDAFFQACHLVTANMPLEGIRLLFSVSRYFDSGLCPPHPKASMAQDVMKHALELIIYYS